MSPPTSSSRDGAPPEPKARPVADWYRFCPHCGAPAEPIGQVPFRCPECGFANFFGPVSAVGGLVVDDRNRLLLVRRARDPGKGLWGLPGGFVDADETIEEALRREVREETELELASFRYLMSGPNHYNYRGIVAPVIDLFYECHAVDISVLKLAEDELSDCVWSDDPRRQVDDMAFPSNAVAVRHWMSLQLD